MSDQDGGQTKRPQACDQAGAGCQGPLGSEGATPADTGGVECCAPGAGGVECCAPAVGPSGRLRLLIFLVVMAAAAAVLTHALMRKATSADSGERVDLLGSLGPVAGGKEAVFVLLPGDDQRAAEDAAAVVEAAVAKIEARGRRVGALTLRKGSQDHARLAERLSISNFPSVIALGPGCGETVVTGEISEAKLLQAFVVASQPASSCGTATACDPSGCR